MAGTLSLLKQHRVAVMVSALANLGSMLFGFDTGIAGAVIALRSFQEDFGMADDVHKKVYLQSNIVALLNAGAFFGGMLPPIISRVLGRPRTITLGSFFLIVGGVLQVAAQGPSLSMIYAGRVIAGFGVGMVSNLVPSYVAECSPKELRGMLMSVFELALASGGVLAYWTSYGCSKNLEPSSKQWRLPLGIQVILAVLIFVGSLFTVESPRWLAKMDRWEESLQTTAYLRGKSIDDEGVRREVAEMRVQIEHEVATTQGHVIREFIHKSNWKRIMWGILVPFCSVWTGQNALLYYGPTVFAEVGYSSQSAAILATGVFTLLKLACTLLFLIGMVQVFKRKTLLAGGALVQGAFLFTFGALLKTHPPKEGATSPGPAGQGMMACIYLFVVVYSLTNGPLSWVYIGEMYPARSRDIGMAMSVAVVWATNYMISAITPILVLKIGWKTWMLFGTTNAAAFVIFSFLPETSGLTLEETDVIFGIIDKKTRDLEVGAKMQEKVVD